MTYKFSPKSLASLKGVHPDLVAVCERALMVMDFSIIEGVRTAERQRDLVRIGASQTYNSKHLVQADGYGHAVDFAPYPLNYKDTGGFYMLAGVLKASAFQLGVKLRFGADWDGDGQTLDQTFFDIGHCEIL